MPGDLILIKTPNPIYAAIRRLHGQTYDHVVVVIDDARSLHISYPRAKLVPTYLFTHSIREGLLIRPKWVNTEQRDQFLFSLKHATVGKKYDSFRVFNLSRMTIFDQKKPEPFQQTKSGNVVTIQVNPSVKDADSERVVCSHQIFRELNKIMPKLAFTVLHDVQLTELDFHKFGTFTPEDLLKAAKYLESQDLFLIE